jgi:hypothetical protein
VIGAGAFARAANKGALEVGLQRSAAPQDRTATEDLARSLSPPARGPWANAYFLSLGWRVMTSMMPCRISVQPAKKRGLAAR